MKHEFEPNCSAEHALGQCSVLLNKLCQKIYAIGCSTNGMQYQSALPVRLQDQMSYALKLARKTWSLSKAAHLSSHQNRYSKTLRRHRLRTSLQPWPPP